MSRALVRAGVGRACLLAVLLGTAGGCAVFQRREPPIPLTSPEPHAEPDLVGATHVVQPGETLYRIAQAYGVEPRELLEINDLFDPRALRPGMDLFIPGVSRPISLPTLPSGTIPDPGPKDLARRNGQRMAWPVRGVLYSRYGVREGERHDGIDIAAPVGTIIGAAAPGTVIYAGQQAGYGSIVIVRHDREHSGLVTLYAHASVLMVREGDRVAAGTPIAKVGMSGRTTGPHLHFEIREGARPRNPLFFLP
jgi:murein DD-endopeptidase MepM/ murein hydrolase activator NlpD